MSNAGTRHSAKRPREPWAKNYTEQGQGQPSKRALVEHYLQHQATTALAQMAQQHGIDTHLLRKWVCSKSV